MLGLSLSMSSTDVASDSIQMLVSSFRARVKADGGVFEANACLDAQLRALSNIKSR